MALTVDESMSLALVASRSASDLQAPNQFTEEMNRDSDSDNGTDKDGDGDKHVHRHTTENTILNQSMP